MTISIERELAEYLRGTASVSSTVAEAVKAYRDRELEAELAEAYRQDAADAERLNRQWESADAAIDAD